MSTKIKTIAPIITQLKKTDIRTYDGINKLNKRIPQLIDEAVRARVTETIFLGYYVDGGYAGVQGQELRFQSPIDNYQYRQNQIKYVWSIYSTRTAGALNPDGTSFVNGQIKRPSRAAANSGAGQIYWFNFDVNQDDGSVTCEVAYFDGAEHITNDGILTVTAECSRA
jgi:hypothetical protein